MLQRKIQKLAELLKCGICCQLMSTVGTTEYGEQFCIACIRREAKSKRIDFGDINAVVVDQAYTKFCALTARLLSLVSNDKDPSLNHETSGVDDGPPCKKRAMNSLATLDNTGHSIVRSPAKLDTGDYTAEANEKCFLPSNHNAETHLEMQMPCNALNTEAHNLNNPGDVELESESDDDDDDSFVPPTPEASYKMSKPVQSRKCLMGTSLSSENRELLSKFADFFGADILTDLSPAVRVLVAGMDSTTLKWLYARCRGIPIVKSAWIESCLMEGTCLPVDEYRWEKGFPIPDFLKKLDLVLCPPFTNYSLHDLEVLLKEVVAMVSTFEEWEAEEQDQQDRGIRRMIIGDMESITYDQSQLDTMSRQYGAPIVDIEFLLLNLATSDPIQLKTHLIFKLRDEELLHLGFPKTVVMCDNSDL